MVSYFRVSSSPFPVKFFPTVALFTETPCKAAQPRVVGTEDRGASRGLCCQGTSLVASSSGYSLHLGLPMGGMQLKPKEQR